MNDVEPRIYAMVIREMIRHENDLINHRIMWLLVVQGLIANAYVGAGRAREEIASVLACMGILIALSGFIMLYKSYQARGYLDFLGAAAKRGALPEARLPIAGWPGSRIRGWRSDVWVYPWLGRFGDLLEPYFFFPGLLIFAWLFVLMQRWLALATSTLLGLALVLSAALLFSLCFLWVRAQQKYEKES
jgi:hypothetical protein